MATKKILFLDDDQQFRRAAKSALENHMDCDIVEAATGTEGLAELSGCDFDLVLVDEHLSDIGGQSLISKIRETGNKAPILFMSAMSVWWSDPRVHRHLTQTLGVHEIIHKPVSPVSFAEQVACILHCSEAPVSKDLLDRLQALKANYAELLPDQLQEVKQALNFLRSNPQDEQSLLEAMRTVHSLRGTAGSFGFAELATPMRHFGTQPTSELAGSDSAAGAT